MGKRQSSEVGKNRGLALINLYEDQEEFVQNLRHALAKGYKSILGVASPAFGKTMVAAYIAKSALDKSGSSSWFLVHRKNLLRQTSKSFWASKIEHGLITSGKSRSAGPVQVGTIGTVYSRLDSLKAPKILFIDEAHLAKGNMFETVIKWAKERGSIIIGLTGTPIRLDGKPLDVFDKLIEAKSTQWLIEQGRLSDYEIYSTANSLDLSGVKNSGGDYNREQLAEAMDSKKIVGDVVSHWRRLASGMRTVCYCVNVKHSKHTSDYFNANGIPAVHVDADTTEGDLKEACEGLASGKYLILCNCELVIEGFDLSAQVGRDVTIECCILLRPTQSKARYLQMVFRALRKKPRAAIILDHAGCVMRHGLPDDEQEWSLEGKEKGKRKSSIEDEIKTKQCDQCWAVFRTGPTICPHCGSPIISAQNRELEVVDGELEKVDKEAIRLEARKEQGMARTLEDLVALGMRRGMQKAAQWACITQCSREKRKPQGKDFNAAREIHKRLQEAAQ